jgi:hypothetical protein
MMPRRLIAAAAALALLALGSTSAQANAVTDWNAITQDALIPGRPAGDAQVMVGIGAPCTRPAPSRRPRFPQDRCQARSLRGGDGERARCRPATGSPSRPTSAFGPTRAEPYERPRVGAEAMASLKPQESVVCC